MTGMPQKGQYNGFLTVSEKSNSLKAISVAAVPVCLRDSADYNWGL